MAALKLIALSPEFLQHRVGKADKGHGQPRPDGTIQWGGFETDFLHRVKTLAKAQGIWFDCPKCFVANGGPIGTHGIITWFPDRGVPDRLGVNSSGQPVRWTVSGTNFDDLTLTPSIQVLGGCNWHGFITNGEALTC